MSIKNIIKKQEEEFGVEFPFLNDVKFKPYYGQDFERAKLLTEIYTDLEDKIKFWHSQSIKQILQAVVEREKGSLRVYQEPDPKLVSHTNRRDVRITRAKYINFNSAKQDTINHLEEVIKEL